MVRLVFRPYAQVGRSICTSETLRASTGFSPGFALPERSSPSFGSRHRRSVSVPPREHGAGRDRATRGRGGLSPRLRHAVARGRSENDLAFTPPSGLVAPDDSRRRQTPWSVFQDGSVGHPFASRRRPAAGGDGGPGTACPADTPRPAASPRPAAAAQTTGRPRRPPGGPSERAETARGDVESVTTQTPEGRARPDSESPAGLTLGGRSLRYLPFTSEQFHALLNPLFKVLFNVPSQYLSAIGLTRIFSLKWSLPPASGCIPKQPDS